MISCVRTRDYRDLAQCPDRYFEMTLNIMLTSRAAVFLSGDFRLTTTLRGSPVQFTDDLDTQKLIPVFKFGWSALVAFTGIATAPLVGDVGDWISRQLHEIPLRAPFNELPKRLLESGRWLKLLPGETKIAFSVVGFDGRRPYSMLISNFQDLSGRQFSSGIVDLARFEKRPKEPEVLISGDRYAVLAEERAQLKKFLITSRDPREIQRAMAEVNAAAASRSAWISKQCVTGHLLASGTAEVMPHGIDPQVEYVPRFVKRSLGAMGIVGFTFKPDAYGRRLPPQWKGMTANRQGKATRDQIFVGSNAFANVGEPISTGTPSNFHVFWKIAEENEPERVTFQIHRPGTS